ncbi:MAG: stage II sporulation protein R [Bacillota bacterium]|nr:stage II sporulation protein R [Bacillota bacterium]
MSKNRQGGILILLTGFILICFWGMYYQSREELTKDDFIRFHVVANSNSPQDQALKLKVRDEVLNEVSQDLGAMDSAEESRSWLEKNAEEINRLAEDVIALEGYDYSAQTEIGMRWIPEKSYGSITFPAGNYEAFTIKIGEGAGENWWCVMFPPICIIGEEPEINGDSLTEEFEGTKYGELVKSSVEGTPYTLKFKSAEIGENFLEWIKN